MLDIRTAQDSLEDFLRDTILYALGRRLPAVDSIAALRAVPTQGEAHSMMSNNDLINIVVSGSVTAAFRWRSESTTADNGTSVIKPTDVSANGRWHAWTSSVRFAPTVGGNSYYLHELQSGPLKQVIVLDKGMEADEISRLILGQIPAVVIEASGDDPDDMGQHVGWRYDTEFEFKISVVGQNMRAHREATHGGASVGDSDPGVNSIDGLIASLLGGVALNPGQESVRVVKLGRGDNYVSELGQRRVIRERAYRLLCTVENPPAPNDAGVLDDFTLQAQMTDLHDQSEADLENYVVSGIEVIVDTGLTQMITIGSAFVAGTEVSYAGASHLFTANSDTYRDLKPNGTLQFVVVDVGAEEPAVTATALRIGVTRTDATSVVSDRYISITKQDYAAEFEIPLE